MSYQQQQMQFLKFDKRLLEINLKNGSITEEEYKQHLAALNDDVANSEALSLDRETAEAADTMTETVQATETMEAPVQQPTTPTNSDPFGSGY